MQLFVSHSTGDTRWVDPVRQRIEEQGFHAYLAENDIRPGHVLNGKIQQAIAASDAVVVVLTETAAASAIVREEIGYAIGLGKPVVPLVAPSVASNMAALGMLNGLEYVLFDLDDPQTALLRLTEWVQRFALAQQAILYEAEMERFDAQLVQVQNDAASQAASLEALKAQQEATMALLVFVGAVAAVALVAAATSN